MRGSLDYYGTMFKSGSRVKGFILLLPVNKEIVIDILNDIGIYIYIYTRKHRFVNP